jgi:molybdopterin-guanine dinucleotide biosynthesis protein A
MGRDKAMLPVGGRPMGERVAEALAAAGVGAVFCVGGAGLPGLELVADRGSPGRGPMGGVLAALDRGASLGASIVVVLACDLPDVSPDGIRAVVSGLMAAPEAMVAVPIVGGKLEPLHAAWRVSAIGLVPDDEAAVHRVIAGLPHIEVAGLDPSWLRNVNSPSDLVGD